MAHHANGEVIPSVRVPGTEERIFVARQPGQLMGVISGSGGSHRPLEPSGPTLLKVTWTDGSGTRHTNAVK